MAILNKSSLLSSANIIRNETVESANTAQRVGSHLYNSTDTLFNTYCRIDKKGSKGFSYIISGYDYNDIQLQVVHYHRPSKTWKFVSGSGLQNQHQGSLEIKFVDANAAKTARPRVILPSAQDTVNYANSTEIQRILTEMDKLRTNDTFQHIIAQGETIAYNTQRAGGYYDCSSHTYGGGANKHFTSPRYGLALTYKGKIVSNVLAVKIGYVVNTGLMKIKNV